jgi:hypothetical protein
MDWNSLPSIPPTMQKLPEAARKKAAREASRKIFESELAAERAKRILD